MGAKREEVTVSGAEGVNRRAAKTLMPKPAYLLKKKKEEKNPVWSILLDGYVLFLMPKL